LTGRLASRYSATGQTNRRIQPNLYGGALNGRSEIRSISPSSVQATADLLHSASDFRIARSVRKPSKQIDGKHMMERATDKKLEHPSRAGVKNYTFTRP
jgi:hypothetical protein